MAGQPHHSLSRLESGDRQLSNQRHATGWITTISENSNLFWPITWYRALIQGWDATLRSPMLWHHLQAHLVYANQIAQATSPINGGLICPNPNDQNCPLYIPPGYSPVDHDQRNTLNVGRQRQSAVAQLRLRQCVLRIGLHQRLVRHAAVAISRTVSTQPHHGRSIAGKKFRRRVNTQCRLLR